MKKLVLLLTAVLCFVSLTLHAETIGKTGNTYSIVEPDAYEEIKNKMKQTNWQKLWDKMRQSAKTKTKVNFSIAQAKQDKTFYVDPTYTLPFDITDDKGKVIYPEGYRFNPLDYMQFPYTLLFFNANSVEQVTWIMKNKIHERQDIMFIAVSGDVAAAQAQLKRIVYGCNQRLLDKFQIKAVPSFVYSQNRYFVVREVPPKGGKK